MTPDEIEKRRFARISNHFFIRSIREEHPEEELKAAGIVHDISRGGLSFLTEERYVAGDRLELEIELAGIDALPEGERGLLNWAMIIAFATVVRLGSLEGLSLVAVELDPLEEPSLKLLSEALSRMPAISSSD